MEKETFSEDWFAEFGDEAILFCNIISMVEGAPDQGLLMRYQGSSLPHQVVVDAEGRLLAQHDGGTDLDSYRETLARAELCAEDLAGLRARAAEGESGAKLDLLRRELELGHLSATAAEARLAELPAHARATMEKRVEELHYSEVIADAMSLDLESIRRAAARWTELHAGGKRPPLEQASTFWYLVGQTGQTHRDADLLEAALGGLDRIQKALAQQGSELAGQIDTPKRLFGAALKELRSQRDN